eukprot:4049687-Prymnesium_polylepis.1
MRLGGGTGMLRRFGIPSSCAARAIRGGPACGGAVSREPAFPLLGSPLSPPTRVSTLCRAPI